MPAIWKKLFNQEPVIREKKPEESQRGRRSGKRLSTPKKQIERLRTKKSLRAIYPRYNPDNPAHNPQPRKKYDPVDRQDRESDQSTVDTWNPFRRAGSSIAALAESFRPKHKSRRPPIPFEAAVVSTMDSDDGASLHCSSSSDSIQPPAYIQHATGTRVTTRELAASSTDSLPQLGGAPKTISQPRSYNRHDVPHYVSFRRLPAAPLKRTTNRPRREIPFEPPPPLSPVTPPPEYSLYDMHFSTCEGQSSASSATTEHLREEEADVEDLYE